MLRNGINFIVTKDHEESCSLVARSLADVVLRDENACLGLATGGSMTGVYAQLVLLSKAEGISFGKAFTVNLDEYLGLEPTHSQSYHHYMEHHLFRHLDFDQGQVFVPNGTLSQKLMLGEFQEFLASHPRDIQLLGVGSNGHIGFNEPAPFFSPRAHIVTLEEKTRQDNRRFFNDLAEVPIQAVTMGIGDILDAERIVMVIYGASKLKALKALLDDEKVDPMIPCTALKLHSKVDVIVPRDLAQQAELL